MDIYSVSPHLIVTQPYNNMTYCSSEPPNRASAGDVFYSTAVNQFQVYNGTDWITLSQGFSVDMSPYADDAIKWAIEKMREEAEIEELAKDSPAVQNALDTMKKAEEQLKIIASIAKTPEND